MSTGWGYFVYYRIDPGQRAAMPWAALFAEVERRTGIAGRLYGPADDGRTWMEVYEPVPAGHRQGFEEALAEAVSAVGMAGALPGGERRHVEAFPQAAPPPG